ncbi:hypothetical protein BTJ39_04800 [Izhakiella australiensis]|uniref:Uncharacterized protein n=1 Tax=Izhakiella australiensis TaxID=1926881 RepID=A0A1S8YQE5_9GAMM|nr:hypothetical protein BTJ39_04800 [Izhakiella australiensis]
MPQSAAGRKLIPIKHRRLSFFLTICYQVAGHRPEIRRDYHSGRISQAFSHRAKYDLHINKPDVKFLLNRYGSIFGSLCFSFDINQRD